MSSKWPQLGDNGGAHGGTPVKPIAAVGINLSVEYGLHWVRNSLVCVGHVYFICIGYPTRTSFFVEYGLYSMEEHMLSNVKRVSD